MTPVHNPIVLITGASGAIGQAVCLAYARKKSRLLLLTRESNKLSAFKPTLLEAGALQVDYFTFDFRTAGIENYLEFAQKCAKQYLQLDSLVHCAGTLGSPTPIEFYPPKIWEDTYAVNFTGPMYLTQAMLPLLKRAPKPQIYFSINQHIKAHPAFSGAYGIAHAALSQFANTLTAELGHTTIQIKAVTPKPTQSALRRAAFPAEDPSTLCSPFDTARAFISV